MARVIRAGFQSGMKPSLVPIEHNKTLNASVEHMIDIKQEKANASICSFQKKATLANTQTRSRLMVIFKGMARLCSH